MSDKSPPQQIKDRYRLVELLGKGGMGSVYRAYDETLDRDVAIKFLPPAQVADRESSMRFLREARAVARLSHPNIMTLYDMGREDEWHYLVLEYIPGTNLHHMMKERGGALPIADTLEIIRETLKALAYAHSQGLIHRDIKPENILLNLEGQVKIADFGLALATGDVRLTSGDVIVGTAFYMAPETVIEGIFDHRADLYSIGAVLYELLTGKPPYMGETPVQILTNALNTPLTVPRLLNPGIPEVVEDVIVRLLAKDPDERYATAQDALNALPVAADLETLLAEEIRRATSERLSRTLLERIVRPSSTTLSKPGLGDETDTEDALLTVGETGTPEPAARELLIYAAHEDIVDAVEAERHRTARALQETIISQLNLLLSQASVYEQTMGSNAQARMAISVLSTLGRQILQQTRDLETSLHPAILESLGLEPALESLAGQELRARGLHITLALQRMRERLSPQIELALFRATQDAVDRAVRFAHASQITIRLERREDEIYFSIGDNGVSPTGDILRTARQRVEGLGGVLDMHTGSQGGLELVIRFAIEPDIELSDRELDVIALVAEGLTNKEIGALLFISPRTVKFHLDNIYSKLGVNSRTEAAIYALRRGWVRRTTGITP